MLRRHCVRDGLQDHYGFIQRPTPIASAGAELVVQEFVLSATGSGWSTTRQSVSIREKGVFAPANLRATADNAAYKQLVHGWMDARHTLRYSGGMVGFCMAACCSCNLRAWCLVDGMVVLRQNGAWPICCCRCRTYTTS